ncbi:hypothetical protein [Methanobrevibacter sp.]|uniref:hypothetical protein n=1 Tax=Methanobrevibacter sp. TaxID=66852 RepID=UPI003976F463
MNVKDDNMMLNPKDYRREFEAASLKKVLQERDRIVQFMQDYENHKLAKKYYERDPSPRVIYFANIEYLKEICDLIKIKTDEKDLKETSDDSSPFITIERVISKFDDDKRRQFLDDLKVKDENLYYRYLEWKVNGEG